MRIISRVVERYAHKIVIADSWADIETIRSGNFVVLQFRTLRIETNFSSLSLSKKPGSVLGLDVQ